MLCILKRRGAWQRRDAPHVNFLQLLYDSLSRLCVCVHATTQPRFPRPHRTNLNESALFECNTDTANTTTEASTRAALAVELGLPSNSPQLDQLLSLYNAATHYGGSWRSAYIDIQTDLQFFCDSRLILDATSNKHQPAFA